MAEYASIPDGWQELTYETDDQFEAHWVHSDEQIGVGVTQSTDADGTETYPVVVEQHVEHEQLATTIQSHALVAESRPEAERMAAEFMHEVDDGQHVLRVLDVEQWQEFYQFYCIADSELPGDVTADELIEAVDNEEYDDSIDDLPNDFDPTGETEQTVTVDVFPRHQAEIETDDTQS
jgi:hypothetical protein